MTDLNLELNLLREQNKIAEAIIEKLNAHNEQASKAMDLLVLENKLNTERRAEILDLVKLVFKSPVYKTVTDSSIPVAMTTAAKLTVFTSLAKARGYDVSSDKNELYFLNFETALAWTEYFERGTEPSELWRPAP